METNIVYFLYIISGIKQSFKNCFLMRELIFVCVQNS